MKTLKLKAEHRSYFITKVMFLMVAGKYSFMSFLQDINKEQTLLEKDQSQFPMLQTLIADKQPYEQLWTTALNFQSMSEEWMNGR